MDAEQRELFRGLLDRLERDDEALIALKRHPCHRGAHRVCHREVRLARRVPGGGATFVRTEDHTRALDVNGPFGGAARVRQWTRCRRRSSERSMTRTSRSWLITDSSLEA